MSISTKSLAAAALLVLLIATLRAQGAAATTVIDPSTLTISNVDAEFGAQAARVRRTYAGYVAAFRAGRLAAAPVVRARTIDGRVVDLKATFGFINELNIALALEGKTTLSKLTRHSSIPSVSTQSLARAANVLDPRRLVAVRSAPPPVPVVEFQSAPPPDARPCPAASSAAFDPGAAWTQLAAYSSPAPAATPAPRCSLGFAAALDVAESRKPAVDTGVVGYPAGGGFRLGDRHAAIVVQPALRLTQDQAGTDTLSADAGIEGSALGVPDLVQLFTLDASITAPVNGPSAFALDVKTVNQSLYSLSLAAGQPEMVISAGQFDRHQTFTLFPPVAFDVGQAIPIPFGANVRAELECVGRAAFNGTVQTSGTAIAVHGNGEAYLALDGGFTASFLVASAHLDGELTIIDASGDLGMLASLGPDRTAKQFSSTLFANDTPMIALYRPYGVLRYKALAGTLRVRARIAGLALPWHPAIPFARGATGTIDYDTGWHAVYLSDVVPAGSPPTGRTLPIGQPHVMVDPLPLPMPSSSPSSTPAPQ